VDGAGADGAAGVAGAVIRDTVIIIIIIIITTPAVMSSHLFGIVSVIFFHILYLASLFVTCWVS